MCKQLSHWDDDSSSSLPRSGIDFLSNQSGLKDGCFLSMEAVDWVLERVDGATTRADAVNILQVRLTVCL